MADFCRLPYPINVIHSLRGRVTAKENGYAILETGGVGFKIFITEKTARDLLLGSEAGVFTHLQVKEDALDLYGFVNPEELRFFELLISVSGVGPKSALAILEVGTLKELCAAIEQGRPDLLTRASGIGRKTAERIIVELRGKVTSAEPEETVRKMEGDSDLVETLIGLGYRRDQAKSAVSKVDSGVSGLESRLKAALKILKP